MSERVTAYLTKEQAARIAGLSIDSLVGVQIHTDASDDSTVTVDMVPIDDPNGSQHFEVYADGSYRVTT